MNAYAVEGDLPVVQHDGDYINSPNKFDRRGNAGPAQVSRPSLTPEVHPMTSVGS